MMIDKCPFPIAKFPKILLPHGGGGKLTHQLIEQMFTYTFQTPVEAQHDGAICDIGNNQVVFTTDSYVVSPLFFPGGNIGTLAINGTVNDLVMCGAKPLFISVAFIIEEGFATAQLWEIVQSMQQSALQVGAKIITGDTKVVNKGKGDGIFINTSGIGKRETQTFISATSIQQGDAIILSNDLGRHGIAIMAAREGLEFESTIKSDCAALDKVVLELIKNVRIRCLRDLTRGGLATVLVELAKTAKKHLHIEELSIPVIEEVEGACELLGLDPLYVANEGCFIAIIDRQDIERALEIMHQYPCAISACHIGQVLPNDTSKVTITSKIGVNRIVDMLSGEQLPRIC